MTTQERASLGSAIKSWAMEGPVHLSASQLTLLVEIIASHVDTRAK